MNFDEKNWIHNETGELFHKNEPEIKKVIDAAKAAQEGINPHVPVEREEDGTVSIRDALLNSKPVQFENTLTTLSETFLKLIELLKSAKF